jgi:hypothetical protein
MRIGRGGGSGGVSANEYSCTQGAQINFEDLTPYLICGILSLKEGRISTLCLEALAWRHFHFDSIVRSLCQDSFHSFQGVFPL